MHSYLAYGLHLGSEISLPELPPLTDPPSSFDVLIRRGSVPSILSDAPDDAQGPGIGIGVSDSSVHLEWPAVGSFLVSEGREITICPHPNVPNTIVRLPLLGVVLGVALHQRGRLTLHASAVSIGDRAVAFVGQKGAGKSTMVAALQARGHALLTDDVLAIDPETHCVDPAFPQIKLCPDAPSGLDQNPDSLLPLAPDLDKGALRDVLYDDTPQPLGAVFILDDSEQIQCTPLEGLDAFFAVMEHRYAPRFLGNKWARPSDLPHYTTLASTIPIVRLERPRDFRCLPDVCATVEAVLASAQVHASSGPSLPSS